MENSIVSIGQASALLQVMPSKIHAAAGKLEIEPKMRINGIDHFAEVDLDTIGQYLHRHPGDAGEMQRRANSLR